MKKVNNGARCTKAMLFVALSFLLSYSDMCRGQNEVALAGSTEETWVTESRDVSGFDKIDINGSAAITILVGKPYSLQLKGTRVAIQGLETIVQGDTLLIKSKSKYASPVFNFESCDNMIIHGNEIEYLNCCKGGQCFSGTFKELERSEPKSQHVEITLNLPFLSQLKISGAAKATVSNINSPSFNLKVSGAGKGTASGAVGTLTIDLSGAANVDATSLTAKTVHADVSGSSRLGVAAQDVLYADVSGVGAIAFTGNPRVHKHISGIGRISRLE